MRTTTKCAAAALLLGLAAGCGGLTQSHTEFAPGRVADVSVQPTSITMAKDDQPQALDAVAHDSRGLLVPSASFTWSSANPGVATVDAATGKVTPVAPGTTGITGTEKSTGMVVHATVTVTAGAVVITWTDIQTHVNSIHSCSCHEAGGAGAAFGSMADPANVKKYVTAGSPQNSLYYMKGSGQGGHAGGNAWGGYASTVSQWIQKGAQGLNP